MLERPRAAGSRLRREDLVDLALVAVMLALTAGETLSGNYDREDAQVGEVLFWGVVVILPLTVRRRFPVAVWFASLGLLVLQSALMGSSEGTAVFFVLLVGGYTVAAYRPRRTAVLCLVALVPVTMYVSWRSTGNPFDDVEFIAFLVGGFFVAGRIVWSRNRLVERLAAQSEELRRSQAAEARAVAAVQRERIARDVHDVVAHSVSLMVVQAEAGEAQLSEEGPSAECLRAIQRVGRSTLTELRGLLATMGDGADEGADEGAGEGSTTAGSAATHAPSPRLRDVDDLVGELGRAGLDVDLRVEGSPDALPPGVDLAAYRILQEALTNALRHAGGATVRARVRVDPAEVVVEVVDDGGRRDRAAASNGHPGSGRGLDGMRERARLYGGDVESGPTADGFRVLARIPVPAAVAP
ncbi:sensor histidine kinase [Nocardioides guangzhouensis]|uniref:sensor histidine kinase n=1 Tax=Nocardioides guangzhouensis TaxID=2497878 RepID=UPI0014386CD4|nr:histidine kinase [Nocardioides guangzhouensis]